MVALLGFLSFFLLISSFVVVFKPSLIRQQSRLKAFSICWIWSSILAFIGIAFEGTMPWLDAAAISLSLLIACWAFGRYLKARAKDQSNTKTSAKATTSQFSPVFSKKGTKSPTGFTNQGTTSNKAIRSNAIDSFEQSLTTLWVGHIKGVEFTYVNFEGDRSRRQIDVEELVFNECGQFYIRGFCHKRVEQRTFKVRNIETKIKVGSKRYEFEGWCTQVLGLPPEVIDDIKSLGDI